MACEKCRVEAIPGTERQPITLSIIPDDPGASELLSQRSQIDLTPLAEELGLKPDERYAIRDAYATITAISEHGGFVDIGTDIFDLQVRAADVVTLLVDED